MNAGAPATIGDLYKVDGKAELVNGEIVYLGPDGAMPGFAADEVFVSLRAYARKRFGVAPLLEILRSSSIWRIVNRLARTPLFTRVPHRNAIPRGRGNELTSLVDLRPIVLPNER